LRVEEARRLPRIAGLALFEHDFRPDEVPESGGSAGQASPRGFRW
jgi:hypothetical protein